MSQPALLILDYSGTLSLEAVAFGRPERLESALRQSGLWDAGITIDRYWNDLVTPTWHEGSTTPIGLRRLLSRRLSELGVPPRMAARRAARFTRAYISASIIDPAWQPLFAALRDASQVGLLIATDHYAEITAQIIEQLAALRWPAVALRWRRGRLTAALPQFPGPAVIANSAELGVVKADPLFWQRAQTALALTPARIVVVDDFGASENLADAYAHPDQVQRRRQRMISALEQVFSCLVHTIWFTPDIAIEQTITAILAALGA